MSVASERVSEPVRLVEDDHGAWTHSPIIGGERSHGRCAYHDVADPELHCEDWSRSPRVSA